MGIDICVPTYNRLSHLKKMINSVRDGIGDYPYHIIVADGGSTDGAIEYLKKQKDVTLVEMGELTGCVKAYNACIRKAKYEYIFWPSDDFILVPKVIVKCCKLMDEHPEIGMVSTKFIESSRSNFPNVGTWKHRIIISKTHVFRANVLREIGLLNEHFRTYYPDADSSLAVLDLGYVTLFTREVGAIHSRVHDEVRELNIQDEKTENKEKKYFETRWEKKIDPRLNASPYKLKKAFLFWSMHNKMRDSRVIQYLMGKNNKFAIRLFDWFLQQCVVFRAKEYEHLTDFYLAQKIPKESVKE